MDDICGIPGAAGYTGGGGRGAAYGLSRPGAVHRSVAHAGQARQRAGRNGCECTRHGEEGKQDCTTAGSNVTLHLRLGRAASAPSLAPHLPCCLAGPNAARRLPQGGVQGQTWELVRRLVPHLPGLSASELEAMQQRLAPLPGVLLHLEHAGLQAFGDAVRRVPATSSPPPPPPAGSEEEQELALRRAHALAARKGCANPRCTSLAGPCEAGARGSRCSGCRLVRFCCVSCSRSEWPRHKLACKPLQRQRQQQAAA